MNEFLEKYGIGIEFINFYDCINNKELSEETIISLLTKKYRIVDILSYEKYLSTKEKKEFSIEYSQLLSESNFKKILLDFSKNIDANLFKLIREASLKEDLSLKEIFIYIDNLYKNYNLFVQNLERFFNKEEKKTIKGPVSLSNFLYQIPFLKMLSPKKVSLKEGKIEWKKELDIDLIRDLNSDKAFYFNIDSSSKKTKSILSDKNVIDKNKLFNCIYFDYIKDKEMFSLDEFNSAEKLLLNYNITPFRINISPLTSFYRVPSSMKKDYLKRLKIKAAIEDKMRSFFDFPLAEVKDKIKDLYPVFYVNNNTTLPIKSTGIFPFPKSKTKIPGFITASNLIEDNENYFENHEVSFSNLADNKFYQILKTLLFFNKDLQRFEINSKYLVLLTKIFEFGGQDREVIEEKILNLKEEILDHNNKYMQEFSKDLINKDYLSEINNGNPDNKLKKIFMPYEEGFLRVKILEPFYLFINTGNEIKSMIFTPNVNFEKKYGFKMNRSKVVKNFDNINPNKNIFLYEQSSMHVFKNREITFSKKYVSVKGLLKNEEKLNTKLFFIHKKMIESKSFTVHKTYRDLLHKKKEIPLQVKKAFEEFVNYSRNYLVKYLTDNYEEDISDQVNIEINNGVEFYLKRQYNLKEV